MYRLSRNKLQRMLEVLEHCDNMKEVISRCALSSSLHLLKDIEMYSLFDLERVRDRTLLDTLAKAIDTIDWHIRSECEACKSKASLLW